MFRTVLKSLRPLFSSTPYSLRWIATLTRFQQLHRVSQVLNEYSLLTDNLSHDEFSLVLSKVLEGDLEENPEIMDHQAWSKIIKDVSIHLPQMKRPQHILECLRFVLVYDSQNTQLLTLLQESLRANLSKIEIQQAIEMIGVIHSLQPQYPNQFIKILLSFLKSKVSVMSIDELSHFLIPFAFYDQFEGKISLQLLDKKFLMNLDTRLKDDSDLMKDFHIARICGAISISEGKLQLSQFLEKVASKLQASIEHLNKEQIIQIASAYSYSLPGREDLFKAVEKELTPQILTNVTLNQGVKILDAFSTAKQGSQEFYVKLDMLFGKNINSVAPSDLDIIVECFVNSGKQREKFMLLMQRKIASEIASLSLTQMSKIVKSYTEAGSDYEKVYKVIEPYLYQNLQTLTEDDLMLAFIGFLNPKLNFSITYDLQHQILKRKQKLQLEHLSQILYAYSVLVKENRDQQFLKALLERLNVAISLQKQEPSQDDVIYLLTSFEYLNIQQEMKVLLENFAIKYAKQRFYSMSQLELIKELLEGIQQEVKGRITVSGIDLPIHSYQ